MRMTLKGRLAIGAMLSGLVLVLLMLSPEGRTQNNNPLVGSWHFANPDQGGGTNQMYFTYSADGKYRMVSIIQGGRNNGSEVQRWGTYRSRQVGPNQFQVQVQVTGGAPQQICAPGQGCTPVRNIQSSMNLQLQVQGNQMRQGDGSIFVRAAVPQRLMVQLPAVRNQAPVAQAQGGRYTTPGRSPNGDVTNIPGLGKNCDDQQQAEICHIGGGTLVRDARGCEVCQK